MTTNRRDFLKFGTGALIAQCLPAMAEKDREIWYAAEPQGEALLAMPIMKQFKPTHLEIKVGVKTPFELLHMSDSHIAWMNSRDLIKADDVELKWYEGRRRHFATNATGLAAALAYAKAKKLPILHTGDLVDYISDANIHYVQRDLEGVDCQYAVGNHELGGTPRPSPKLAERKKVRELLAPYFPNPFTVRSRVLGGVNFVTFDDIGFCRDITEAEFAAIRKAFALGLPTVLAYHIPFHTPELVNWMVATNHIKSAEIVNDAYLVNCPGKPTIPIAGKLAKWLPQQKNLKAMLCGHLHAEFNSPFCEGVTQYVAGATFSGNAYHITFV